MCKCVLGAVECRGERKRIDAVFLAFSVGKEVRERESLFVIESKYTARGVIFYVSLCVCESG